MSRRMVALPGAIGSSGRVGTRHVVAGLALLLILTFIVYRPGLEGPFLFDDHGNILMNPSVRMKVLDLDYVVEAARSANLGPAFMHRPLARVSFALNYYFAGGKFDRFVYKATNLGIHMLNGVLVFILASILARRFAGRDSDDDDAPAGRGVWIWFPLFVTIVWLLHPIQLTSVLYVVQRMTSMAATGVLLGVVLFSYGRSKYAEGRLWGLPFMVIGVLAGMFLGVLSKETAVLTPFFAGLIEIFFFSREELTPRLRRLLKLSYTLIVTACVLIALSIAFMRYEVLVNFYDIRNFSPLERLLTQPRILFFYVGLMFLPSVRRFGLFHDDLPVSHGLLDPWTTALALLGFVVLFVLAIAGVKRRSMLSFGILWFLVGHSIESTIVGLELVHEHRNYVPSVGVIIAASYYLFRLLASSEQRAGISAVIVVFIGVLVFATHTRSAVWDSRDGILYFAARNHPESYRSVMGYGALLQLRDGDIEEIYGFYRTSSVLNEYNVLSLVRMQRIVSGLIHQFREGSLSEDAPDPANPAPLRYHDSMVFRLDYVEGLDVLIGDEIAHRLRSYAFDAESVLALNELRQCIGSIFTTCPPAPRIESWLQIALDREHLIAEQQAAVLITMGRLKSYAGDLDAAIEMLEQAVDVAPGDVTTLIEMALIYIAHGDYDGAWAVTLRAEPLVMATGRRASDFTRLKTQLAEHMEYLRSAQAGEQTKSVEEQQQTSEMLLE